jgi:hypothetical protein
MMRNWMSWVKKRMTSGNNFAGVDDVWSRGERVIISSCCWLGIYYVIVRIPEVHPYLLDFATSGSF